jgi:hypothetical protein
MAVSQEKIIQTDGVALKTNGPRRLPVYFVLDLSGSARGGLAANARRHTQDVITQLQSQAGQNRKEYDRAPVFYTIIVFRSAALQLQPLASLWTYPLDGLLLNEIATQGASAPGAALATLRKSMEHELKMPGTDHGDDTPLVFLFTDKVPNKEWACIVPGVKTFVCGIPPSTQTPAPSFISGFLPFDCQAEMLKKVEAARDKLKTRQQMIDYPTDY